MWDPQGAGAGNDERDQYVAEQQDPAALPAAVEECTAGGVKALPESTFTTTKPDAAGGHDQEKAPKQALPEHQGREGWVALDAVRKPLSCQLCHQLVASSLVMACSHVFCGGCLYTHLSNKPSCPTCQVSMRAIPVRCLALDQVSSAFVQTQDEATLASFMARSEDGTAAANKLNKMFWWLQSPTPVVNQQPLQQRHSAGGGFNMPTRDNPGLHQQNQMQQQYMNQQHQQNLPPHSKSSSHGRRGGDHMSGDPVTNSNRRNSMDHPSGPPASRPGTSGSGSGGGGRRSFCSSDMPGLGVGRAVSHPPSTAQQAAALFNAQQSVMAQQQSMLSEMQAQYQLGQTYSQFGQQYGLPGGMGLPGAVSGSGMTPLQEQMVVQQLQCLMAAAQGLQGQ